MKTFEQFLSEHFAETVDKMGKEKAFQCFTLSLKNAVELVDMWQKLQQTPCYAGRQAEPSCGGDCGMNYCDEYGCIDAKNLIGDPIPAGTWRITV
ncbi:MAG: hypothetical protein ACXWDO_00280 [Bacteroidia bacterium]